MVLLNRSPFNGNKCAMDFSWNVEKRPILLQLGQSSTKIGVAGESTPRAIVKTPELQSRYNHDGGYSSLSQLQWANVLMDLLHRLFYAHLQIPPKERTILILDSPLTPQPLREALVSILFSKFHAVGLTFRGELVAPLHLTGVNTGMVVDIGYSHCRVLPVCFGIPVLRGLTFTARAGYCVNQILKRRLMRHSPTLAPQIERLGENVIEDIKVRVCYVGFEAERMAPSSFEDDTAEADPVDSLRNMTYTVDDTLRIPIRDRERWASCEPLVSRSEDHFFNAIAKEDRTASALVADSTVIEAIIECLEKCERDVRRFSVQNILLCGGTAELPGLQRRVAVELKEALEKHVELSHLTRWAAFGCTQFAPFLRQWVGASVIGALDSFPEEYPLSAYLKGDPIPDELDGVKFAPLNNSMREDGPTATDPDVRRLETVSSATLP